MSIPASDLVTVTPRVLAGEGEELAFSGLFLTTNQLMPVDTVMRFYNATAVAEFFGYDSDAYKAATVYFNGFDNSQTKPSCMLVFRHMNTDAAAFVRGLPSTDEGKMLSNLKSVTNGQLVVNLGPQPLELTGLNFNSCTSLSACAELVADAIHNEGATTHNELWTNTRVEYSSLTKAFSVFAGTTGGEIAVSPFEGNVADLMGLSLSTNATTSAGGLKRTYSETMDKVMTYTGNFVTFSTIEEVTNVADAQALALWSNTNATNGNQFLYVFYSTDVTLTATTEAAQGSSVGQARVGEARAVNAGAGTSIVADFAEKNYEGVAAVYGDVRYAAFVMGCAASIAWDQPNSTITFAFKSQTALEANVTDKQTASKLKDLRVNFMGDYASRNEQFVLFQEGYMFGQFEWIDTYLNSVWLNNQLQSTIINGFKTVLRVPHTEDGYSQIRAWVQTPIQAAARNGIIETGITLSDTQIQALTTEAGFDISDTLSRSGYFFQIDAATAQQRNSRESPPCRFWYTCGGAVHKLTLPATAIV